MGEPSPPDRDSGARRAGSRAGAILQFLAALLASVGVGSLFTFFRKRGRMKAVAQDAERQAAIDAELARKRELGHEPVALNVRVVIWLLVAAFAGAVVLGLALFGLISFFSAREQRADVPLSPLASPQQLPPGPRLQVDPSADWQQLRATDEAVLNSYGWVDQPGGAVRIPVDRAMDLLAQRGLPVRSGGQRDTAYDQAHDLESVGGQPSQPTPVPLGQASGPTAAPQPTGTAAPSATAAAQPTGAAGTQGSGQ